MVYIHGKTTRRPATEADLAQARHHNAQLAAELRQLEAIGERLQAAVDEKRAALEADRDDARAVLAALKAETVSLREETQQLVDYRRRMALMPPPIYGGRDGLLAATAEIEAYDNPAKAAGPSHGTRARYYAPHHCRCAACNAWHEDHKARARQRHHARPARHLELAA
jgi:hypothetical protein